MIQKNWLVRTFDKKILGPISREKLISLILDGKLSESDEICPGNHFWVFVKELDLCSKLLDAPEILDIGPKQDNHSAYHGNSDEGTGEISIAKYDEEFNQVENSQVGSKKKR